MASIYGRMNKMLRKYFALRKRLVPYGQDILLLLIRIHWGWGFVLAGYGKFTHLDKSASYFDSLGLPLPYVEVLLAGGVELIGGVLLLVGLGASWVPVPLIVTMLVALFTAHYDALHSIVAYPDIKPFLSSDPFLYLFASCIVFFFGAGGISFDGLRSRYARNPGTV
jgi:putative oxidoreductase